MAIRTVSIGTAKDIYRFDDADTEYGFETDAKMKVGTAPAANDEVVRYQDIPTRDTFILPTSIAKLGLHESDPDWLSRKIREHLSILEDDITSRAGIPGRYGHP